MAAPVESTPRYVVEHRVPVGCDHPDLCWQVIDTWPAREELRVVASCDEAGAREIARALNAREASS